MPSDSQPFNVNLPLTGIKGTGWGSPAVVLVACRFRFDVVCRVKRLMNTREFRNEKIKSLSARELDVLRLLTRGLSNRQMGEELGLSIYTIKTHMKSIFKKLEVTGRMEAAILALNLIDSKSDQRRDS